LANELTSETLDQTITLLSAIREERKKTEAAKKKPTQTKKEKVAAQKKHNEVFGGSFEVDEYDNYTSKYEDEFM
jgi:hypothetical protein